MKISFSFRLMHAACFVLLLFAFSVSAQSPNSQNLILNQPTEREIKGGEAQFYTVQIAAMNTARIEIEHKGADMALTAFKPGGEKFIETDSPAGFTGKDWILVTAAEAGEYKIAVEPTDSKAVAGRYIVTLAEIRPTVAEDNLINEAAMKIQKLAEKASTLRGRGTREERRQAVETYRQIIELSAIKKDKIWEIFALAEMDDLLRQLGEMQRAVESGERSLRLAREVGNREHEGTALNNLGVDFKELGDYEKGILYLTQALDIQRETNDKRGEAIVLNNLGGCYLMSGNFTKAAELYQQSIVLRRAVKDRRGEANTLNNLGLIFAQTDNYAKAIEYLEQALTLRRELGDKTGEAITLRNLANSFRGLGERTKAVEYYGLANALAKRLGDRRVEADSAYGLALAERELGNLANAIETVESGLALTEQIRNELITPELRIAYFSSVQRYYELYIDLLAERYEREKNEADIALALQTSERARARSLVELLQEARVNIKQGVDRSLIEQTQDLQDKLNFRYRQRTAALAGGKATPEQLAKVTTDINSLTAELESLQVKVRRDNPRYADLTQGSTLSAKEIQKLLDDETVLLEYKLGAKRSFLWLVTKDSIQLYTLPTRDAIEKTARGFYDSTISRDKTKEMKTGEFSNKLSQILLAPVAAQIENKRLAIVADGVLQFIPFASLQTPGLKSKSQNLLIETNEIVILPSASVLAELRRNSSTRQAPEKTIAVFADPIFEADDPRLAKNVEKTVSKPAELGRVLRDFNLGETLPRLLSSREEARNISGFVSKNQAVSNVDFEASRENATSENLAHYRILHFATHGLLDTSRPEFSGLVFSLYDKNGKSQDGFLRLNQVYNLNLNSDLVVLSACQTALGKDVRGEGLIGLTRGFMYAGARRVVASLWKVDDAATAEFMRRVYQNHLQKNLSPAAALRKTQNEMRQIPRFRSAYFWAGFTLQGEWN